MPQNIACVRDINSSIVETISSEPLFHVREYNLIMFGWLCLTIAAFIILHWFSDDVLLSKAQKADKRSSNGSHEELPNSGLVDEVVYSQQDENKPLRVLILIKKIFINQLSKINPIKSFIIIISFKAESKQRSNQEHSKKRANWIR